MISLSSGVTGAAPLGIASHATYVYIETRANAALRCSNVLAESASLFIEQGEAEKAELLMEAADFLGELAHLIDPHVADIPTVTTTFTE